MDKNLIYFADKGLTTTSANHIANLAKEWQAPMKDELNSINFVNETIEVVGNGSSKTRIAWTEAKINSINRKLEQVAEADLLVAWLREAIKAKDTLLNLTYDFETWCAENNIEVPERPFKESVMNEDDYIASLTIKERQEWLKCNQMCAVLGKYIHPDGAFSEARKILSTSLTHPTRVDGSGRDTIITRWSSDITTETVDATFFELQDWYRSYQAKLNGFKHAAELAVLEDDRTKSAEYAKALNEYEKVITPLKNQFEDWKKEEKNRIANYKIIIPNDLKEIYDFISNLGKK